MSLKAVRFGTKKDASIGQNGELEHEESKYTSTHMVDDTSSFLPNKCKNEVIATVTVGEKHPPKPPNKRLGQVGYRSLEKAWA